MMIEYVQEILGGDVVKGMGLVMEMLPEVGDGD
jgi:hypothetical protein